MQPQGLAFNPNDTANASLYIGNGTYTTSTPNVGQIDKLSGGVLSTWVPASPTTVVYPSDLTFDAFGNLVVTDANAAKVISFNPAKAATQLGTGGFTLTLPLAAENDFGGNMYIADAAATGRVIMIPGETFASYTPSLLNLGAQRTLPARVGGRQCRRQSVRGRWRYFGFAFHHQPDCPGSAQRRRWNCNFPLALRRYCEPMHL